MSAPVSQLDVSIKNLSLNETQAIQSPIDSVPVEIFLHILSYLEFVDLWRTSQVCKDWYQCIREWKLLPEVKQLITDKMVGNYVLCISPGGLGFFIYGQSKQLDSESPPQTINTCQKWDLKNDTPLDVKTNQGKKAFIGCNYYCLTKEENTLSICDLSSGKIVEISERTALFSHFSINKHGFTAVQHYATESATLYFTSIKSDRISEMIKYKLDDCNASSPVSLLHEDWLIYTLAPGVLRVRDVTKEGIPQVGKDLFSPEIDNAVLDVTREEIIDVMLKNTMTHIVASGSTLVTLALYNATLLVWNLDTRQVIQNIPSFYATLDALDGYTLLTHTSWTINLWDLKEEKFTKKAEWENNCSSNDMFSSSPTGYYNNKVYILSQKEGIGTLTVYNFSKKASLGAL